MPQPGDRFGDFVLSRELGRGAMGVVWEAWQESLSRAVALKVLSEAVGTDPVWVARFKAEANAAARLSHPGILPVYAVGETHGLNWFAMEKVDGEDLAQRLKARGPFAWDEAARYVRDAALALEHAHQHGVLHRDIKPANLMLRSDGRVALTDFGLSKETTAGGLTTTGMLVGTPYYMSPELLTGDPAKVTPASDIYSLGISLYELLTGQPPFQADSAMSLIRLIADEPPARPSALRPGVPRDLETIALVCLAKEPAKRYPSAQALADDLGRFLAHEPITRRRPGLGERALRFVRRNRVAVGVGALALLGLLGVTVFFQREIASQEQGYREEIARLLAEADALAEAGDEEQADALHAEIERRAAADPAFARDKALETARDLLDDLRNGRPLRPEYQREIEAWAQQAPARITLSADAPGATVLGKHLVGGDASAPAPLKLEGGALVPGLWRLQVSAPGRLRTVLTLLAPPGLVSTLRVVLPPEGGANAGMLSYGGAWFPVAPGGEAQPEQDALEQAQPAYLLASERVTGSAYKAFLDAQPAAERERLTPAAWKPALPSAATLTSPLPGLTFEQAQAYAATAGGRLPRDMELMNAVTVGRIQAAMKMLRSRQVGATAEERSKGLRDVLRQLSQLLEKSEGLKGWDGRAEWAVSARPDDAGAQHPWPVLGEIAAGAASGAEEPASRRGRTGPLAKRTRRDLEKALEGQVFLRLARPVATP